MTASATIDIATIMPPQTETTSGSKISAADASSDFASALDNASKNYGSDNSATKPANYTTKNASSQNSQVAKTEQHENTTDVSENNTEKTSEKLDTAKTDQNEKVSQDDNKTQQADNKVQDNNQAAEQKDTQNPETESNTTVQQVVQQAAQQPNQETEQPITANETTNTKDIKKDDEATDTNTATVSVENLIQNLSTTIQAEIASATANTVQQPANTQDNQVQTTVAQAETVKENLNVDLTSLANNSAKIANSMVNNTQIQTQTQQALSNVKINLQNAQQPQVQTLQTQQAQAAEANTIQTQSTQTPVIEVSADVAVSDQNAAKPLAEENNKSDIQNVLKKTAIIQEAINKTNAQITNVETSSTSNQNSNNLLNNQSAQEQVVKLAIENNSVHNKVQNVAKEAPIDIVQNNQNIQDAALKITTATSQTNFAQTLNNVQTQNQAPQELGKTNILSQIENQLNAKQLQTGETTKVSIILQPENLGKITLELVNSKEGLTAKMTTDNEQVKEILSKHLDNLKETMSNQGINVGNLTVKVDETQKQSNEQSNFNNWQAKQENQEFSNNTQNQNNSQNEFGYGEKGYDETATEADADISVESEPITEKSVENTVSISVGSGRVDYKI